MSVVAGRRTFARRVSLTSNQIFLQYYTENDVFFSPEGILKLISIVCCVALSVVSLRGAPACSGAGAPAGAAGVALGVAAALALLVGARALHVPRRAPLAYLLADIVVCAVSGALAALSGALVLALCRPAAPAAFLHGPLALVIAGLVIASAWLTYVSAMRVRDAAAGPAREPRAPPAREHEV